MDTTSDKVLLAGPWVGEFGWELFGWQGYLRHLSKSYKEVHVISRPGHGRLYEDFAASFHEFDPQSWETAMQNCYNIKASPAELVNSIPHTDYFSGLFNINVQYDGHRAVDNSGMFGMQVFHKYQKVGEAKPFDLLFHPRNKPSDSLRNWSKDNWQKLVDLLKDRYTIATIGNEQAFALEGTTDLRAIPLAELIDHMCCAKLVVGPSSGPMHLASLCGTKHLVWSSEVNRLRYKSWWNPFSTEVEFVSNGDFDLRAGWNPDPQAISDTIHENLVRSGL